MYQNFVQTPNSEMGIGGVMDFAGYWNHRLSHHINFFWNQHVIHHSSEEFNLACALRQSISNLIGYFPLLLFPAAMLGYGVSRHPYWAGKEMEHV